MKNVSLSILILSLVLFSCAKRGGYPPGSVEQGPSQEVYVKDGYTQVGIASWYGIEEHNNRAASGERFSKYAYTAAHKTLPMGTVVRVTNLENGRDVIVKINDRGPFVAGRIIDLSHAAAKSVDMITQGTVKVKVEVISTPSSRDSSYFDALYTVQVASFSDNSNARKVKMKLDREYDDVRVEQIKVGGDIFYRVRVGRYSTKNDAQETAKKLSKQGYNSRVILE